MIIEIIGCIILRYKGTFRIVENFRRIICGKSEIFDFEDAPTSGRLGALAADAYDAEIFLDALASRKIYLFH
ncbi:hypothetical protein B7934_00255 [Streptococcus agalactiae]|nr:hypothetical protein B7934_00255 [Streptococcus agalactiae]